MVMDTKLILPVTLGVSLVAVSAFVVYYVFKKEEDEDLKPKVKTSRVNVIELSVPKSIVPALIGRSGSNIKEIEKKSGALIHFKKFSDKDYDVCIIRGRSEATQLAETLVHDFINHQPVIVEDTLTVPTWACGRIIGTGGENINDISHRSGARVKIDGSGPGDNSLQRQVTFRGTAEQIQVAMDLIQKCVAQEKCRREIEQSKRSPRHATPPAAADADSGDRLDASHVAGAPVATAGSSIEVYVSAVSSPARFWVQLVGSQVSQLDALVDAMTEYYNDKDNRKQHALSHVSVGQVVAAVFRHDGKWYRARVHDIRPNEFDNSKEVADVFFVDYGDSEYVNTHELCELRPDLLRLRFQAMECFLAGVRPAGAEAEAASEAAGGYKWHKWPAQAVERFEELTQVARWKRLISRTCTYMQTAAACGEKDKEIPGIKLYDVTEEGEVDIGAALVAEGLASEEPPPRPSPRPAPPFGDLGHSRVLGMIGEGGTRASSVPKDHKDDGDDTKKVVDAFKENEAMTTSKSLGAGLNTSDTNKSVPTPKPHLNGSNFLDQERQHVDKQNERRDGMGSSDETLVPTPIHSKSPIDELKANMNRIDSHHDLQLHK